MIVSEMIRQIASLLRYLAAPLAGLGLIWVFNVNHHYLFDTFMLHFPWSVGLLLVFGLIVYYGHRTIIHPCISWIMKHYYKITDWDELSFARWRRRGSSNLEIKAVQSAIDEASASSHFFYCVGFDAIALAFGLPMVDAQLFALSGPTWCFVLVIASSVTLGLIGDIRTTRWDIRAFKETPKQ